MVLVQKMSPVQKLEVIEQFQWNVFATTTVSMTVDEYFLKNAPGRNA